MDTLSRIQQRLVQRKILLWPNGKGQPIIRFARINFEKNLNNDNAARLEEAVLRFETELKRILGQKN